MISTELMKKKFIRRETIIIMKPKKCLMGIYNIIRKNISDLKNLTNDIEFGCNFKDGLCRMESRNSCKDIMCCCSGCKSSFGYLDNIFAEDIPYYAKKYDKKTGFWRKGKGCILDRDKRSETCLSYNCSNNRNVRMQLYFIKQNIVGTFKMMKFDEL